jgi:hypothetical protein
MKSFLMNQKLALLGAIIGMVGGLAYYELIGKCTKQCSTGACAITSTAAGSTIYGAIFCALVFSMFKSK